MKAIKLGAYTLALCLAFTCQVIAQGDEVHARFEGWCDSLGNASSADLVQFLSGIVPDEKNARCVTWALHKLGKERYDPAIASAVRLLDFRRPPTPQEKMGFYDHPQIIEEIFPAAEALEMIGKKALPDLLGAIEADATSSTARENAVAVWMEIYKHEQAMAVAVLKQAEMKASSEKIKERFSWAVQKALTHCNSSSEASCRQAATTGTL